MQHTLPDPPEPSTSGPARVWTVYTVFALSLLLVAVGAGTTHAVLSSRTGAIPSVVAALAVTALILIVSACAAASASPAPWVQRLGLQAPTASIGTIAIAALGAPALGLLLDATATLVDVPLSGSLLFFSELVSNANGGELALLCFALSIGPGVGEELLFRGYIQTRLVQRHGARTGIIITSILFGLMHLDQLQSVMAAILGLYMGWVALRLGSIVPAIIAHALNNLVATLATGLLPDFRTSTTATLALAACGTAVLSCCLFWTSKHSPSRPSPHAAQNPSP